MKNFDVNTVALEGNNLIEASAGTGKTYSVGILVLRLLIEKAISVKEILLVTFTDAAVEELKTRIRSFIYQAWLYSKNSEAKIEEPGIKTLIDNYPEKETVVSLLNDAMLLIDEISIFTIHGFCTRTLKEFAFETNQNFDLKMMADMSEINNEALHTVWRKNITTLPVGILTQLISAGFSQTKLQSITKEIAQGKELAEEILPENTSFETIEAELILLETAKNEAPEILKAYILENESEVKSVAAKVLKSTNFYKEFGTGNKQIAADFELFVNLFLKLSDKEIAKFDDGIIAAFESYKQAISTYENYLTLTATTFYLQAANEICAEIKAIKSRRNLQSFDDLIHNLHQAIISESNNSLIAGLQQKYKAVFIDEFQDTDKLQYEIFSTAFENSPSVMFYIGDPKQSIYAFRKADLDTYKLARSKANCFTMDKNFRSNNTLLQDFNAFFDIANPFEDEAIEYQKVNCGKPNLGYVANAAGEAIDTLEFFSYANASNANNHLVEKVLQLFSEQYQLIEKGKSRKIEPSDIGILVRSNRSARELKLAFGKRGLPAVVVDDSKIFNCQEVNYAIYILQAISEINNGSINKALGTPLFLDSFDDIAKINHEAEMLKFEQVKNIFNSKGVYSAFQTLLDIYSLRGNLLTANYKNGNRIITNFLHIVELLHKQQMRFKLTLDEMIDWLKRAQNGGVSSDNNFEQRLESDENAVSIITIHKSKGLAYNIVFAPSLESTPPKGDDRILNFKEDGKYKFTLSSKNESFKAKAEAQAKQEEKRLIYVALTRAVYYCGVYGKEKGSSSLSPFLQNWKNVKGLVSVEENLIETTNQYVPAVKPKVLKKPLVPRKKDVYKKWSVLSYSSIATHNGVFSPIQTEESNSSELDAFVFNKMPRGTNFGNFIHYLLENISFADAAFWDKKIHYAAQKYLSWQPTLTATNEQEQNLYIQLLQNICNTNIKTDKTEFKVADIQYKISEMQFYFNYNNIDLSKLQSSLPAYFELEKKTDIYLEGLMNGFIDLVFEMEGKFYILDWKTNYLGNHLDAYNQVNLLQAMNTNNYHLQYMIYTVALVRYLRKKLPDFNYDQHFGGVLYLFVRGIRQNSETGIYFNRLTEHEYVLMEECIRE